ncbi:MAG: hypothetical protein KF819_27285 [Labilithrix sp.]|nr:hypothetical protein [Labilithrix sp.]
MRKLTLSIAFLAATTTFACSFRIGGNPQGANAPQPGAPAPAAPGAQPAPGTAPAARGSIPASERIRIPGAGGGGGGAPTTPPPATTPPAAGSLPVLAGTNVFGTGTPDPAGWKGTFFVIPPATQKLPAMETLAAKGVLFAKDLNVGAKTMTGGFPGIDATKNEDFAIRWEAPLIVDNPGIYDFRIVSDDGAKVLIDNTLIVDNDGQHGPTEKSGPVNLIKGAHVITVDYFQATGQVALQLFCKKQGGTESVCPTRL